MSELRPCPFCGGKAYYAKVYDRVDCINDECRHSVMGQMTPAQWNRRADPLTTEERAFFEAAKEWMRTETEIVDPQTFFRPPTQKDQEAAYLKARDAYRAMLAKDTKGDAGGR